MFYRISGRSGSGKTQYIRTILSEKTELGVQSVVIVPVQQSMEYEKSVFTELGDRANLYVEVLTFDRLPNRTYREYGGLAVNYIDDGGRALLMARALGDSRGELHEFNAVRNENAFIAKMLDTSRVLKENGVPHKLLAEIDGDNGTAKKARDIDTILTAYDSLFTSGVADSRDALDTYADNLAHMDFFRGKTVFIDSFNSFTVQQRRVIDCIARQCDDIYVTFTYDAEDTSGMFGNPAVSYNGMARHNIVRDIILDGNKRTTDPALLYAEENLWTETASPYDEPTESIMLTECGDKFEEAEATAAIIAGLVRKGYRYRDIAIILRSPESYRGIIDTVLEKHGIPCWLSERDSVMIKPLTVFVLSAVEATAGGYSLSSVLKLIKSGFTPLTARQANILMRYARTWSIRGRSWISEADWLMNPAGFREAMSHADTALLAEINSARRIVAELLSSFAAELGQDGEFDGKTAARALYSLLKNANADEKLRNQAKKLSSAYDEAAALKLTSLWDVIIGATDQLYLVCGDESFDAAKLLARLELLLSVYTVGSVPASCDSVTVGNASLFRSGGQKAVVLLGVNDGEFPASPSVSGVFDSRELGELEKSGIHLEDNFDRQLDNERLFFYTSVAMPSEKLYCVYTAGENSRASAGAERLRVLFPKIETGKYGKGKPSELVFSPASARENGSLASEAALKLLREQGLDDSLTVAEHPLSDKNARIETAEKNSVALSPTGLEKYTYCGFSYFGRYVLRIAENKKADFAHAEIGNFIHKVLEVFISSCVNDGRFVMPSDAEIKNGVDRLTDEYILTVCGATSSKRFTYTFNRLKTTLRLLLKSVCEELDSSLFVPVGFEVSPVSGGSIDYVTENGVRVTLRGKADRIDEFRKNGKTYVRVVDYKTGSTVFDRKALDNGLELQMFLYLFAYCAGLSQSGVPAGVTYIPAKLKPVKPNGNGEKGIEGLIEKSLKRSGLILDDPEIVEALEQGTKKRFIPVSVNKDGSFGAASSLATAQRFGELKRKTENYVKKLGTMIADGIMDASPLSFSKYDACRYCSIKEACRLSTDRTAKRKVGFFESGGNNDEC